MEEGGERGRSRAASMAAVSTCRDQGNGKKQESGSGRIIAGFSLHAQQVSGSTLR